MSPLVLRRSARRLRRHAAGLLAVSALSGAIALHHGALPMNGMDDHHGMSAAIEMCLGVFTAVGAAVAAVAVGLLALGRWPTPNELVPNGPMAVAGTRMPEARAGPPPLPLLCVWRR